MIVNKIFKLLQKTITTLMCFWLLSTQMPINVVFADEINNQEDIVEKVNEEDVETINKDEENVSDNQESSDIDEDETANINDDINIEQTNDNEELNNDTPTTNNKPKLLSSKNLLGLNWEGIRGNVLNESWFGTKDGMYILLDNEGSGGWTGVNRIIEIKQGVTVTIDMNGKYLSSGVDGPMFDVYGTLILKNAGENNSHPQQAVIERDNSLTNQSNLITVHSSGRLDIIDSGNGANGIDIKNSHSDSYGGAIFVIGQETYGGTFNLYDPKTQIYNCDENVGGGVLVQSGATFNMYAGTISNCKATNAVDIGGGGVFNDGTFNMYGGTIRNCSSNLFGGGVFSRGTFNMYGGTIDACKTVNGGGVFNKGTFNMYGEGTYNNTTTTGATIQNCEATGEKGLGGAIFADANSKTIIDGGTITGCKSSWLAGGVYQTGASVVTLKSGTVSNCSATGNGGGFYVDHRSTINIEGGGITGCISGSNGGGIYLVRNNNDTDQDTSKYTTLNMSGGTISGCTANNNGGGIYLDKGAIGTMSNGTIESCSTTSNDGGKGQGAGIAIFNGSSLNMTGGIIQNNTASRFGGGVINDYNCKFTMTGGTIQNNTANQYGGGGINSNGTITISNAIITGNTCNTEGKQIRVGDTSTGSSIIKDYCTIDNGVNDLYQVTNNITKSKIIFNKTDGTGGSDSVDPATFNAAMPSITVPTLEGYSFDGYFDFESGGTKYYKSDGSSAKTWDKIIANTTLYAQWKVNIPTAITGLTYNGQEQVGVAEGNGYTLTNNKATNAGTYTATATLEDGNVWSDGTPDPKNITFIIDKKDISGSTIELEAYEDYSDKPVEPKIKSVTTLDGLNVSTESYLINYSNNELSSNDWHYGKVTITANDNSNFKGTASKEFKIEKKKCTVSFVTNGGTILENLEVYYGTDLSPSDFIEPTKNGYSFSWWYTNESLTTELGIPYTIKNDIILYAKYNIEKYTISYNLNDGTTNNNPQTYTIETDSFTLNNPTKEGYVFTGWTGTNLSEKTLTITIEKGSTGNREYAANYDKYINVPLAKDNLVCDDTEQIGVEEGEGYTLTGNVKTEAGTYTATASLKDGYVWSDGTYENKQIVFTIKKNKFEVSFNVLGNGETGLPAGSTIASIDPITVKLGDTYGNMIKPVYIGYTFIGWFLGDVEITEERIVQLTDNVTLVAHWRKIDALVKIASENELSNSAGYDGTYSYFDSLDSAIDSASENDELIIVKDFIGEDNYKTINKSLTINVDKYTFNYSDIIIGSGKTLTLRGNKGTLNGTISSLDSNSNLIINGDLTVSATINTEGNVELINGTVSGHFNVSGSTRIIGGIFLSTYAYVSNDTIITGGSFNESNKGFATWNNRMDKDQYKLVYNEETNLYDVTELENVVSIGEDKYKTLTTALKSAQDGDTLVLLKDLGDNEEWGSFAFDKKISLELNNHSIIYNSTSSINISNDVTINGEGTINCKINVNNGTTTINNVTLTKEVNVGNDSNDVILNLNNVKNDDNSGYFYVKGKAETNITGGTIRRLIIDQKFVSKIKYNISGDAYFGEINFNNIPKENITITGGNYPFDVTEWLRDCYIATDTGYNSRHIVSEYVEASINGTKYKSFLEAYNAAQDGDTIKIEKDLDFARQLEDGTLANPANKRLAINKAITIDTNGHRLSYDHTSEYYYRVIRILNDVEFTGNGFVDANFQIDKGGTLTITGGTFENIIAKHGGDLVLVNGTFYNNGKVDPDRVNDVYEPEIQYTDAQYKQVMSECVKTDVSHIRQVTDSNVSYLVVEPHDYDENHRCETVIDNKVCGAIDKEKTVAEVLNADGSLAGQYFGFKEAIDAATTGQTVRLVKDYDETQDITISKNIIIDLNGHTLGHLQTQENPNKTINIGNNVKFKGEGDVYLGIEVNNNGTLEVPSGNDKLYFWNLVGTSGSGKLNVNSGNYYGGEGIRVYSEVTIDYVDNASVGVHGGSLIINDGHFGYIKTFDGKIATIKGGTFVNIETNTGIINIEGGSFSNTISGNVVIKGGKFVNEPNSAYIADGYIVIGIDETEFFNNIDNNLRYEVVKGYKVTLDNQNAATSGTTEVIAAYNNAMPNITIPEKTDYMFVGYFDDTTNGTKYYNADGTSAHVWDKTSDTTLYAHWNEIIKVPTPNYGLCYNTKWQVGVNPSPCYDLVNEVALNAGTYEATATLHEGFVWADGTIEPKNISYTINKAIINGSQIVLSEYEDYAGEPIKPKVISVKTLQDDILLSSSDFTVTYSNNEMSDGNNSPQLARVLITANEDSNFTGTASKEFIINKKQCTVSFVINDGTNLDELNVYYGTTLTPSLFVTPTKEGYKLSWWYTDESLTNELNSIHVIRDDMVLYAKWIIDTTSSNWEARIKSSQPLSNGVKYLENGIEYYYFSDFKEALTSAQNDQTVEFLKDINYKPINDGEIESIVNKITVDFCAHNFNIDNTNNKAAIYINSDIVFKNGSINRSHPGTNHTINIYNKPDVTNKRYVTFENVNIDSDLVVWADQPNVYVTYNGGNYNIGKLMLLISQQMYVNIEKGNFELGQWFDVNTESGHINITGGNFTKDSYLLNNNGTYKSVNDYCADGYVVAANTDSATSSNYPFSVVEGGNIKYIVDGDIFATGKYTKTNGLVEELPAEPTKDNYLFNGWYDGETKVTTTEYFKGKSSNIVLTAKWDVNPEDDYWIVSSNNVKENQTVGFKGSDDLYYFTSLKDALDNSVDNSTVKLLQSITLDSSIISVPNNVTIDLGGNTLGGFNEHDNKARIFSGVTNTFTVENGTLSINTDYGYSAFNNCTEVTANNIKFIAPNVKMLTGNQEPPQIACYNTVLIINGGSVEGNISLTYNGDEKIVINNYSLTEKFKFNGIKITHSGKPNLTINGGLFNVNPTNETTIDDEHAVITLATGTQEYNDGYRYEVIKGGKMTYNLNGGTLPENYPTYYETSTGVNLLVPTKEDNKFVGWYTDEALTEVVTNTNEFGIGETGAKVLYAKWNKITRTVTLNAEGGTLSGANTITIKLESTFGNLLANNIPTKDGYDFAGWRTEDNKEITSTTVYDGTYEVLYAEWIEKKPDVVYISGNNPITDRTMSTGTYVLTADTSFEGSAAGDYGLKIADTATVYIYIPEEITLTATGKDASETTGGGAGILVPEDAKLYLIGSGTVVATGGNAASGGDGTNGTNGWFNGNDNNGYYGSNGGGAGGNGGGGAGAGIGTSGGTGGTGGAGGAGVSAWLDCNNYNINSNKGNDGKPGTTAATMGTLYIQEDIKVEAYGGSSSEISGKAGSAGKSLYDSMGSGAYCWTAGGSAGGGGGGSGYGAEDIGTGGAGAGGGGGGSSADAVVRFAHDGVNYRTEAKGGAGGIGYVSGVNGTNADSRTLYLSWAQGTTKIASESMFPGSTVKAGGAAGSAGSPSVEKEYIPISSQADALKTTITFNAGEATSTDYTTSTVVYMGYTGENENNKIIIPSKDCYEFEGYYTGVDGSGKKVFDNEGNLINPDGYEVLNGKWVQKVNDDESAQTITLFAKWKALEQVTVTTTSIAKISKKEITSVGQLTGGGNNIKPGELTRLTATDDPQTNFRFDHWEIDGKNVGNNLTLDYIFTKAKTDVYAVYRYELSSGIKVHVEAEKPFTIKVFEKQNWLFWVYNLDATYNVTNDINGIYEKEIKVAPGSQVELLYDNSNNDFVAWTSEKGVIRCNESTYLMNAIYVEQDIKLQIKQEIESKHYFKFVNINNQILKTGEVQTLEELKSIRPEAPGKLGYKFIDWSINGILLSEITDEQLQAIIQEFDVIEVNPKFEKLTEKYKVIANTVVDSETSQFNTDKDEYAFGDTAYLSAPAIEGYVFAYWTIENDIVSYTEKYEYKVLNDVIICANYLENTVEKQITLTAKVVVGGSTGNEKISFVVTRNVPEDLNSDGKHKYSIVENGILYSTNTVWANDTDQEREKNFKFDSVDEYGNVKLTNINKVPFPSTTYNGNMTGTFATKSNLNKVFYMRGYIIVECDNGTTNGIMKIIYTDLYKVSYNTIGQPTITPVTCN